MGSTKGLEEQIRAVFARGQRHFQSDAVIAALADSPLGNFLRNDWIRACARAPTLTGEEYGARLIELANQGRLPAAQFFELAGGSQLQLDSLSATHGRISDAVLAQLRDRLAIIVGRKESAMATLDQELWRDIQGKVVAIPTSKPDGFRYLALDTPEALAFATRILLTSELASRLCRCRYRECSQFFLVDPVDVKRKRGTAQGRLRRDYCRDEHRVEEQRLSNNERQQRIRDTRKAAQMSKTRKKK